MDYAYNTTRTLPAYEDNGEYYFYEMRRDYDTQEYNILNELDNSHRKQSGSGITANVNLQFKFANMFLPKHIFYCKILVILRHLLPEVSASSVNYKALVPIFICINFNEVVAPAKRPKTLLDPFYIF